MRRCGVRQWQRALSQRTAKEDFASMDKFVMPPDASERVTPE